MSIGAEIPPLPDTHALSLYEAGEVDEALEYANSALTGARQEGQANLHLVNALETMAEIQRNEGEFDKAESLYQEALQTAQKIAAPLDQLARLRSGLAAVYDFSHREEQAIPVYEQAIKDYEALRPQFDQIAGELRNNLAMIYKSLGKHSLAEQHYLVALDSLEKALGKSNERVGAVFNNLGSLYYSAGFPEQAKEIHQEALNIRAQVLGPNDPEVAQSYCNLATACYSLEDYAGMQENYDKSVEILEQNLDVSSNSYKGVIGDYAAALDSIGETEKALALQKRAEKMLKRI